MVCVRDLQHTSGNRSCHEGRAANGQGNQGEKHAEPMAKDGNQADPQHKTGDGRSEH
jgi:hypothetical protein